MVYTLTGANSFELGSFLSQLKSDFTSKYGEDGVENYSGEQLTPEIIANALGGISLFSSNRMVIIRGLVEAKEVIDLLLAQLKTVSDEVIVVLIEPNLDKRTALYKTLKKESEFKEFENLGEPELVGWIQSEVKKDGGEIAQTVARGLFEYCGPDQTRLSNEIQKLVSYDTKITKENVELLVERNPRDTIFELLELAMSGQSERAVDKLMALEGAHEDPFQIASMLIWQTHILAVVQTAGGMSDSEIAKIHKINPYVVSKTKRLTSRSNATGLRSIIDKVAKLDITLKTNSHDPWRALEQTLFAL
jgi:DNA polymerase-3 subunit delta